MAFWLPANTYKQRLDACKSLQHTNTNVAAFTRTLNESQFAMRLLARNNQNNRPDKFILLQTDHMEKESGSMQLVKDGWFYFAPADDMKSDIVLEYQEFPSTALNELYTFIGKLLCQYRPVIKFHPEKKKSLLILKLVKTTLNQSSWDNLTAFQQGNLQKALVHEIVLGNQSTFFPTRLSERVEQTKNQMGKNMYSTSQYQYSQNLEEVTNDKIAKIMKQSLFITNQKLWGSQFAFDEIRPDRDSLYSIVELLEEKYFTLDVQEKNIWKKEKKHLHVNTATYTDVHNKHLFYMFKHVLTHYLLCNSKSPSTSAASMYPSLYFFSVGKDPSKILQWI